MNHKRSPIAAAIAATLGAAGSAADAADHAVVLTQVVFYSFSGSSAGDISSSTATFSYNDATNLLTQTEGAFNMRLSIVPNVVTLYRHSITGLVMGNGGAASAATFVCTDGNFGPITANSLCGNYNFGVNFFDESTISYGPGTAFARTLGGDDIAVGDQQSIAQLDGMTSAGIVGSHLSLEKYIQGPPFRGYVWTFTTDVDGDGTENSLDNCTLVPNPSQCDSDGDGYGNHCDGDLNNNAATNAQDYILFRPQLGQPSVGPAFNQADLNCNGVVNSQDYVLFRPLIGSPPGPSGLVP